MRLLITLVSVLLLSPAANAQNEFFFSHEEAGLAVELPDGYILDQEYTDELPDAALFVFLEEATERGVSVEIHTYFSTEQRDAWLSGETAEIVLAHLEGVERVDAGLYPIEADVAHSYTIPVGSHTMSGVSFFGCNDARCYRVDVMGLSEDFAAAPEAPVEILSGVRFLP